MIVIHSLAGGGAERVAADLGAFWVVRGYRETVVTQEGTDTDAYPLHESVKRHVLGTAGASASRVGGGLANLRRVWRLRRMARRATPSRGVGSVTTAAVPAS